MRKFTFFVSMLFAMTVMAQTGGYEVNYTGTKNSDRTLNFVKVESASYGSSSYNLTSSEKVQLFVDATETVTLKVGAGDIVTPSVGFSGSWMHAYVYIDANGDAAFTAGVEADGYTPTGDLVAHSFYGVNGENSGYNSAGTPISGDGRNTVALPTFKAPEATGTYRMRFKIDWNSIDPAGCNDASNTLKANRGAIIDVNLEVAEAQEGIAEQLFNATTITDGQFAKGTAWYTLQIGANNFVIADNGTADHIELSEYISDATDNAQLWAFVGDNTNGYKLYNKNAGTAKVLAAPTTMGSNTGANAFPILVDAAAVPAGYTDMWMFTSSADLGKGDTYFYMYEKGYPANKVNNRDNKLAFWNGGADAGSTLNIQLGQVEYPVSTMTGEWTASNAAGTWAAGWKSTNAPHAILQETQVRNNIAGYNAEGDLQLYTCLANATVNGVFIATYSISTDSEDYMVAGYNFDFVSSGTNDVTVTPNGGTGVTAGSATAANVSVVNSEESALLTFDVTSTSNMFANTSNFYITLVRKAPAVEPSQEIFTTNKGGIPYRIPAIAMAKNGDLIAVADYRHSGSDIGVVNNGRIDLHARISKDNGATWGNKFSIVDGKGANSPDFMHVGFGDPAIVADRESSRVLMLSCAGNVSFQNGTRNNHQNIARFYSEDNGATWSEPVDIAEAIYSMWDNSSNHGQAKAMFVGSGKIHQSRYVKVNNYYRLYCSVLLRNKDNAYTNFVLYSDDFGGNWKVLGGVENAPISSGGDEPKVEELPNGNVVISSRINGGRFFNIFTFTDMEAATGSWGSVATSNSSNNGIVAQGNSTNGEIMIFPVVRNEDGAQMWMALQSVPFGSGRSNVGIYYKVLESGSDYSTPANFAKDWDGRHQASFMGSAYSTMCFQKDSTIAFLYEESTYGADYTIVYKKYTLEQITNNRYSVLKGGGSGEQPDQPSNATIALITEAKNILKKKGVGYPNTDPREVLQAAIEAAEENPTAAAGVTLETALDTYLGTTDVQLPVDGKKYTITMVAKNGNRFYLNYTGSDIAMVTRGEGATLPESAQFLCEDNGDGTVTLQTADGKYLVYHSSYNGVNWLQNGGDTDGLQESKDEMTKITFAKMQNGGQVAATDNKQIFGLMTWYSKRGYDTGKNEESYGYMVLKTDGSNYDGASAPYWNDNFSSGLLLEQVAEPSAQYRIKSVSQDKYLNIEAYNANNATGPKGSVGLADYAEDNKQIFTIVEADDEKVYFVSAEGYYIVCRQWNIDASNTGEKTALGIEYKNDTEFYILNGSQYFKVGPVDGEANSYYPYCDAPFSLAALWTLEEVGNATGIEKIKEQRAESKEIFDLSGRKLSEITAPGLYIIDGKKVLIK